VRARPTSDEQGSVAMALLVILVATTLVVALLAVSEAGLRGSRRAGDSANALQLADAGINDAAKAITANSASFSRGPVTLGTAGSYSYTATKDGNVWHLDSTGTDPTGVKRRVLADAVDHPTYGNAFFALTSAQLKGTADSYTGVADPCSSPGAGVVGSNGTITFTGGTGAVNCGRRYPADGCTFYGQTSIPSGAVGAGACPPPPATTITTQKFIPPPVTVPGDLTSEGDFTCPSPTNPTIPSGRHLYRNITLGGGCQVAGSGTEAVLYATGSVMLGTETGNCKSNINEPPPGRCTPTNWYQGGWPRRLQINVAGSGTVSFSNQSMFWGVINAPSSVVSTSGGGTPQVNVFGSIVASSASSAAQFAFHFDESLLQQFGTGQYQITNWREEPPP
jgi:hypothetical protein